MNDDESQSVRLDVASWRSESKGAATPRSLGGRRESGRENRQDSSFASVKVGSPVERATSDVDGFGDHV